MKQLKRSQCAILPLVLTGKWYDLIKSGEKKEEYRADTPYWRCRFSNWIKNLPIDGHLVIAFSRGYHKPDLFIKACGINIYPDQLHPDWGEPRSPHYVLSLGERVTLTGKEDTKND